MDKFPITVNGQKKLRDELDFLTNVERPKIIDSISVAREHGDLKENAEYHAAREQQSFVKEELKILNLSFLMQRLLTQKK